MIQGTSKINPTQYGDFGYLEKNEILKKSKENRMGWLVDDSVEQGLDRNKEKGICTIFQFFAEATTAHGFKHVEVLRKKHKIGAFILSLLTSVCFIAAAVLVVQETLNAFVNFSFKSTLHVKMKAGLELPRAVLCHSGFFNVTAAEEIGLDMELRTYLAISLSGGYQVSSSFENNISRRAYLKKRFAAYMISYGKDVPSLLHDVAWKCHEAIEFCTLSMNSLDGTTCCQKYFEPIITCSGICYQSNFFDFRQVIEGGDGGLIIGLRVPLDADMFEMDWTMRDERYTVTEAGFRVSLMSNITMANSKVCSEGIAIPSGFKTTVGLEYSELNEIHSTSDIWPWSTPSCVPLNAPPEVLALTMTNCFTHYILNEILGTNCTPIISETRDSSSVCMIEDILTKFDQLGSRSVAADTFDFADCLISCITQFYHHTVAAIPLKESYKRVSEG
ncbi:hypothetical protein SK128_018108 [Halocaridina rubra]|uniref:Uncharacterized protein n=1 Tax=Halocaridina rubra TaxID=373956 RepID=A0AAN8WHQ2_HALRR